MRGRHFAAIIISGLLLSGCGSGGYDPSPGPGIYVTFNVANLPQTLPINLTTTGDGLTEYAWSAMFDVDDDGATSDGDITLEFIHYKEAGKSPSNGNVRDFQALVYRYSSATALSQITTATAQVSGNSITLSVAKSQHEALATITTSTKLHFQTLLRNDQGTLYSDAYPVDQSKAVYGSIPGDGIFTDNPGDLDSVKDVDLSPIDLVTIKVTVE